MEKVVANADRIFYIKLGQKGMFAGDCIKYGKIKLSYHEFDHDLCLAGKWNELAATMVGHRNDKKSLQSDINQIKLFYEEPETTMWITFYNNFLWYGFAEKEVTLVLEDDDNGNEVKRKERNIIGGWKKQDIHGSLLRANRLSGKLTQVQRYQGTICKVKEGEYVLRRINCEKSEEEEAIDKGLEQVRRNLIKVIKNLHPKDFEILVDLIFRNAGYSRYGMMGSTIPNIDMELKLPLTGETAIVQVKSSLGPNVFDKVVETFNKQSEDFNNSSSESYRLRCFLVYHSPKNGLEDHIKKRQDELTKYNIEIIDAPRLAELSIHSTIIDWLMQTV